MPRPLNNRKVTAEVKLLKALAHPGRLRMFLSLHKLGQRNVSQLAEDSGLALSYVSLILRTAAAEGILDREYAPRGNGVLYRIAPEYKEAVAQVADRVVG